MSSAAAAVIRQELRPLPSAGGRRPVQVASFSFFFGYPNQNPLEHEQSNPIDSTAAEVAMVAVLGHIGFWALAQ